jgi:hypothetical protein
MGTKLRGFLGFTADNPASWLCLGFLNGHPLYMVVVLSVLWGSGSAMEGASCGRWKGSLEKAGDAASINVSSGFLGVCC